jgi:hypothetical protein
MSEVKVNKISPRSGTDVTLGDASDTFTIPASATLDVNGTLDVTGATVTGLSAGKVLQVVSSMMKGAASTSSTSMVTTGLEGTITPSSTSSKILISISFAIAQTGGDAACWFQLFKGASVLSGSLGDVQGIQLQGSVGVSYNAAMSTAFNYLDSPSTTSATTYKLMYAVSPGRPAGQTIYMNKMATPSQAYYNTTPATMILMEIEG